METYSTVLKENLIPLVYSRSKKKEKKKNNKKKHSRNRGEEFSVVVLRPKHRNKLKKSKRERKSGETKSTAKEKLYNDGSGFVHLHPVKLGRCKLKRKDREKFSRMFPDGCTSMSVVSTIPSSPQVQTLGQMIGKKTYKICPRQVISKEMYKSLEPVIEKEIMSMCQPEPHYSDNMAVYDAVFGKNETHDGSSQTDDGSQVGVNFSQLRSLSKLGIDVGFIDYYERQLRLDSVGKLILDLKDEQHRRLSDGRKDQTLAESNLASSVVSHLISLSKSVKPSDIARSGAIHKILGINI